MSKKLLGVHEVPKGSELRIGSVNGSGAAKYYKFVVSTIDDNKEMTLPALAGDDVFVFEGQSQTLTNKTLTSAVLNGSISGTSIKDEDNMASDSASHLATQQSIKAYVDAQVTAQDLDLAGDSGTGAVDLDSQSLTVSGGTGLTSSASGQTISIALDDTSVSAAEYGDAATAVTFTVDAQGRLTSASENAISITASQVSDFSEAVDDRMNALAVAGEGIDITYDDAAGSLTFAAELASATNPGVASFASADFDVDAGAVSLKAGSVEFTDLAGAAVQLSSESFSDDDTSLMTSAAIADKIAADAAAFDLDLAGDSGTAAVLLNSQSLTVAGTSNEIVTAASGQTLTISLPDDVTIGNDLTVTGDVGAVNVAASGALSGASADLGGNMTIEGNITHDAGSGNMAIASSNGEVHVEGTQFNGDNVIIPGTLTVQGATTTVSSNEVNIGDNIIVLNSDETGTPSQSAGIEIERGTSANKQFVWDEANDRWSVSSEALYSGGGFLGNASTASQLATGREIEFAGGDVEGTIASFDGSADIANVALTIQSGAVENSMMAANSVDSDQYVDGSIDRVHLAADIVDGTKIADDAVDSEHIADGAIDLAHMSANSVDSDQYVDGSIDAAHLNSDVIADQTQLGATPADGDELLLSDVTSAAPTTELPEGEILWTQFASWPTNNTTFLYLSQSRSASSAWDDLEDGDIIYVEATSSAGGGVRQFEVVADNSGNVIISQNSQNRDYIQLSYDSNDDTTSGGSILRSQVADLSYSEAGASTSDSYALKSVTIANLRAAMAAGTQGGDGIDVSTSSGVNTISVDLKTSGGLKIDSAELAVEPNDFVGHGLEDDGSDNLKVKLHESSAGDSGLEVSSDGLKIGSGLVVNAMMAANSVDSDQYVDGSIDLAHHATPTFNGSTAPSGFQLAWTGSAWLHSRPSAMVEFDCSWDSSGDCSLETSGQPAWVTEADGLIKIELDHASLFGAYAGQSPYFMAQVFVETSNGIQELAGTNMKIDSTGTNECIASFDLDGAALSTSSPLKVFIGFVQMGGLVNS